MDPDQPEEAPVKKKKPSVFGKGGLKKKTAQEKEKASRVLEKANDIAVAQGAGPMSAKTVVNGLGERFTRIQLDAFSDEELETAVKEQMVIQEEKDGKGLSGVVPPHQMKMIEQVQVLMDDPKVKEIVNRIGKDKTALSKIAQEQLLLVVKEEDLFMKFTAMLKLQITIVEMRRIFYWVSAMEIVSMLLGLIFFVAFILHDKTQVYAYWCLVMHWVRAFVGIKVMRLLYPVETWFIDAMEKGSGTTPLQAVIDRLEPRSCSLKVYIALTIFCCVVDVGVFLWVVDIYSDDSSSSSLIADLYLTILCILMLSLDSFLILWLPVAYWRLPPELQKYVAGKITQKCPCCSSCFENHLSEGLAVEDEEGQVNQDSAESV